LRSYHKNISALEANEIVRMSGESIRGKGYNALNHNNGFIPIRANMLKSLLFDYENIPSIILKDKYYEDTKGTQRERFLKGDTAVLVLNVINVLGDATDVKLSLRKLYFADSTAFTLLVENLNDIGTIDKINKNEEFKIKIKFIVNKPSNIRKAFYLLQMEGLDNYANQFTDDFKFQISLSDNIITLKNEKLIVSVSDKGTIGYDKISSGFIDGVGFAHIQYGDHLFEGGFIASANNLNVVSTNLSGS
jgi:hypothetical protein